MPRHAVSARWHTPANSKIDSAKHIIKKLYVKCDDSMWMRALWLLRNYRQYPANVTHASVILTLF